MSFSLMSAHIMIAHIMIAHVRIAHVRIAHVRIAHVRMPYSMTHGSKVQCERVRSRASTACIARPGPMQTKCEQPIAAIRRTAWIHRTGSTTWRASRAASKPPPAGYYTCA